MIQCLITAIFTIETRCQNVVMCLSMAPQEPYALVQVKRDHRDMSVIFWCLDLAGVNCYMVARVFWLVVRVWLGSIGC